MESPGLHSNLQAQLAAQHAVARHLMSANDLLEAGPAFLAIVGELLRWQLGALWTVPTSGSLDLLSIWESRGLDGGAWWERSREIDFAPGVGLPGRAWESGELTWAGRLSEETNLPRDHAAARIGLDGGLAIPVPVGDPDRVVAVVEFFTTSFVAPDESVVALLVGFTDQLAMFITRSRAEVSLRRSESLKSAILASTLDAVIGMNADGDVIEWSQAAEDLLGYRREEALGRELAALIIPPELRDRHREGLARCVSGGQAPLLDQRTEMTALDRHGTRIPVELGIARIPGSDPPAFTGSLRDIRGRSEAERTRDHLATIVAASQDAVMAKDMDGYVTAWNRGAEQIYGYSAEEALGRYISFLVPPDHENEEQVILDRIRRGERVETYETERLRKDGARIDVSLTVSPIRDPIAGITGASIVARDITAEKRRRSAEEFLARSTAAFDVSLDPARTARAIADAAVPELAELCVIDLLLEDESIGEATAAAVDPEIARRLEEVRRKAPLDPSGAHPVVEVLRSRRPIVIRDLTAASARSRVAQSDQHLDLITEAGYSSAAVVPMFARGRLIGALSFLHVRSDRRYDEDDLSLLADLASRAALALDNARLYSERDAIARTLQSGLRPREPAAISGVDVAVVFEPVGEGIEVGGDFYDVFPTTRGCMVLIGDVVGKGSQAAALTAQIRHAVRALARVGLEPRRLLTTLNEVLVEETERERFATVQVAELRGEGSVEIELVSAGHPPAVVATEAGPVRQLGGGTILGVLEDERLATHSLVLAPGETLILYTDGWLDAGAVERHRSPEDFAAVVAAERNLPLERLVQALRDDAVERAAGRLGDDLVILGLRPTPVREPTAAGP